MLGELRRVLRSGGRLLVSNSDEEARTYSGHDRELGGRIMAAIANRTYDPHLERQLSCLLHDAGFRLVEDMLLNHVEHDFSFGNSGYTFAYAIRDYLLASGISVQDYECWLTDLDACAQEGSYSYSVTAHVYLVEA